MRGIGDASWESRWSVTGQSTGGLGTMGWPPSGTMHGSYASNGSHGANGIRWRPKEMGIPETDIGNHQAPIAPITPRFFCPNVSAIGPLAEAIVWPPPSSLPATLLTLHPPPIIPRQGAPGRNFRTRDPSAWTTRRHRKMSWHCFRPRGSAVPDWAFRWDPRAPARDSEAPLAPDLKLSA
jgi:hypothetical protein